MYPHPPPSCSDHRIRVVPRLALCHQRHFRRVLGLRLGMLPLHQRRAWSAALDLNQYLRVFIPAIRDGDASIAELSRNSFNFKSATPEHGAAFANFATPR